MMMALAGTHALPSILIPGGVTLLAENGEDAGKVQSAGARYAHGQISLEAAAAACAAPAPLPEAAASSWAPRPRRRWSARRSACRCPTPRSLLPAIRSGSTWPAAPPAPFSRSKPAASPCATCSPDAAIRNAMVVHAAFGGSTNLILHLPAIAHAAGSDASHRGRLGPRQPPGSPPRRFAAQRPDGPSHRSGLPGRRRPRGHAAPARAGLLETGALTVSGEKLGRRTRLVGAVRTPRRAAQNAARNRRHRSRRRHHGPRRRQTPRPHLHGHLSQGQPRARRLGHQEHRHRPQRASTPTASTARPAPRASSAPKRPPSPPSKTAPSAPATSWC